MPTATVAALAMIAGLARRRPGHRLVPVLVPAQLLPIAGHDEQRIVRAGTEHEHQQDARGLRVDGDACVLGQQVHDGLGDGERHERGDHREQPHHRAAIGQQQDHDDHGHRRIEQGGVNSVEGFGEVRRDTSRSGDVRRQPVGGIADDLGHLVDDLADLEPAALTGIDLGDDLQRLPSADGTGPTTSSGTLSSAPISAA